ncbi:DUF1600 domain-containing protein [Mycoplasma tullyi]|uniref:DUF1600 domain-containing protein n=1 Tax=Mycoplasma tullyi TaxID=1612150 RepID=A0A7D7YJL1_9MOLU|nr:DUF1600 domain-containing protein [Mycoplasma tullyi]QMT98401.1 DUF1600 domain-containing protein [Mycoplasma tullyi]
MNRLELKKISVRSWYKNQLNKSQRIFLFAFIVNAISVLLVLHGLFSLLFRGRDGFLSLDKFTNQTNILIFFFSLFYVFFPKHSFLKNDKFLIACITYIFITFFVYNLVSISNAIAVIVAPKSILAFSYSKIGYGSKATAFLLFIDLFKHLINPIVFIVCGFFKFVYDPNLKLKKLSSYLLPIMIYPAIYCVYVIMAPFVYNRPNGMTYSVYNVATNTKDYPQFAYPAIMFLLFVLVPVTTYLTWFGARKISKKYEQNQVVINPHN